MIYIISVTYNDIVGMRRTIASVRQCKTSNQRFVVIDGGSTDGTKGLCILNQDVIDYFISERDNGIYDAMNKALRIPGICDNDYLIWINGGDELIQWPSNLEERLRDYDCAFYNVYVGIEGNALFKLPQINIRLPYNEKNFSPKSVFYHQGFFIRVKSFREMPYDLTVGIQAENLLMSRSILRLRYYVSQEPVAKFYLGGSSSHYWALFRSWFNVARELDFSFFRLLHGQFWFVSKQLIKMLFPQKFIYKRYLSQQSRMMNLEV